MRTRLLEDVRREIPEEDDEKSQAAKKSLTAQARGREKIEVELRPLEEERWGLSEKLRRAIYLDRKPEMIELKSVIAKILNKETSIKDKFAKENSLLQEKLRQTNLRPRELLVKNLDRIFHSLKTEWRMGSIVADGFRILTNSDAVVLAKERILSFIREVGGVTSGRDHWVCSSSSGRFLNFSIQEIFDAAENFEKELSCIDVEVMLEKTVNQNQMNALRQVA